MLLQKILTGRLWSPAAKRVISKICSSSRMSTSSALISASVDECDSALMYMFNTFLIVSSY